MRREHAIRVWRAPVVPPMIRVLSAIAFFALVGLGLHLALLVTALADVIMGAPMAAASFSPLAGSMGGFSFAAVVAGGLVSICAIILATVCVARLAGDPPRLRDHLHHCALLYILTIACGVLAITGFVPTAAALNALFIAGGAALLNAATLGVLATQPARAGRGLTSGTG